MTTIGVDIDQVPCHFLKLGVLGTGRGAYTTDFMADELEMGNN